MSNQKNSSKRKSGEIQLIEKLSNQIEAICLSENYSDITFIIDNERLYAHKVILASRSEYFRALLYGGLSEASQAEIKLSNVPLQPFKMLLKYIYSGKMSLSQMKEDTIFDLLDLANQYALTELQQAISEFFLGILKINNCCSILDAAKLYNLSNLNWILNYMDRNADDILKNESFKSLSKESLQTLLERDSFFAPEIKIFEAVKEWCKFNSQGCYDDVVKNVRLPLIPLPDLLTIVRSSNILSAERLLDAIEERTVSKTLPYRGARYDDENVASIRFGSKTIKGESRSALLENTIEYDMEKGYTRHSISDNNSDSIVVELGKICIINHIKILLWDRDSRSYSYFIEVRVDTNSNWTRICDYSKYYCRSWQFIYFEPQAVKFIKLVGTHNTVNKVFHVVSMEAMYSTSVPKMVDGLIAPTQNVATIENSATVLQGVSRTRNALLNGDVKNYDWDCGYTCHQLGSGEILIQLGQPYYIGSFRLLLWDCDDRYYSFYIEASVNDKDFEMIVDKRNEQLQSWQSFHFEPRPICFIKIIGTYNTANEIFHCVHFECPSQENGGVPTLAVGTPANPSPSTSNNSNQI